MMDYIHKETANKGWSDERILSSQARGDKEMSEKDLNAALMGYRDAYHKGLERIAEMEAEYARLAKEKTDLFWQYKDVQNQLVSKTAQEIIQYIVDQSTVGIMAGHDAFFVDTTDIMILKERYGV